MIKFFFAVFFLGLLVSFSGCTPPVQSKERGPVKIDFPQDEDEEFNERSVGGVESFPLEWNEDVQSEDYLELVSNLLDIHKAKNNSALRRVAVDLVTKLESTQGVLNKSNFSKSPFVELIISKAGPQVREAISEIDASIEQDSSKLYMLIGDVDKEFVWPKKTAFDESIALMQKFVDELINRIPKLNLLPVFEKSLIQGLKGEIEKNTTIIKEYSEKIQTPKKLSSAIAKIEEMIKEFGYENDPKTEKLIVDGKRLAGRIDTYKNSSGALKALLEIWLLLDQKGRISEIKSVSPDLYDFLNGKEDGTIRCMIKTGCSTPWNDIIADLFIEPKLDDYGLEKLRRKLNEGAHSYTVNALEAQITATLPLLAKRVTESISKRIIENRRIMESVRSDVVNVIYNGINGWAKNNFDKLPTDLYSYEKPKINVQLEAQQKINIQAVQKETMLTSSASIGSGVNAYVKLLNTWTRSDKHFMRVFLNQINKVLGFGGVEYRPDYINPGLIRTLERTNNKFSLKDVPKATQSFVLVDNISLVTDYTAHSQSLRLNVNAKSQSQLFVGLSNFMAFLKDWEVNEFDRVLGNRDAAEIFPSLADHVGQKLFPKEQFFTLLFAHTANMLLNITKEKTPFLIYSETQRKWFGANENIPEESKPVTMAAVVDIKDEVKSDVIRSENVSRWIVALGNLLKNIDGLEKTKVPELIKKDETGKSPVDSVIEAKRDISDLIMGLANLLSSQMVKNSQVVDAIHLNNLTDATQQVNLLDQLLAINALVAAYEIREMRTYLEAAKDIYQMLYKNLNFKTNFYEIGEVKSANPFLLSHMIKTMEKLLPHLKEQQQNRLKYQIKIWTFKLEKLI